jgi:phosphate uptake regulator
MPTAVAAQVTLIARFYERLGDHAVNLSRRIAALQG